MPILAEAKKLKSIIIKAPTPRNPVVQAGLVRKWGSGSHNKKTKAAKAAKACRGKPKMESRAEGLRDLAKQLREAVGMLARGSVSQEVRQHVVNAKTPEMRTQVPQHLFRAISTSLSKPKLKSAANVRGKPVF